TVHDGFTLNDLVSYNEKHNEANGEDNKDGESNNHSWNCGVEGPTDDPEINELRERQKRNLLASLFVSQGTPLLLAGDEMGRTQGGNNNGYCQDDDISWLDWRLPNRDEQAAFVGKVVALRRSEPALRRTTFLTGEAGADGHKDVLWVKPDGEEMADDDWTDPSAKVLGELLCGQNTGTLNDDGTPLVGNSVLVLVNAHHEDVPFVLPGHREKHWSAQIDTFGTEGTPEQPEWQSGESYPLRARSVVVLTQRSDG
ncbi:MAG: glgX, partial [Rhizobacter sp.]|nr:glgX [Rhizobacter sp.]